MPVIDALCAVRVSVAKIKIKQLKSYAFCYVELLKSITCEKLRRATKAPMFSVCLLLFCPVELLKTKTSYKPRRAREAAAAARFFDESVRNSCARRATTPQTASWRQGEFRAEARKRWRRCVTLVRTPLASVSGAQQLVRCALSPRRGSRFPRRRRGRLCGAGRGIRRGSAGRGGRGCRARRGAARRGGRRRG